ncbi:MAG: hypothetical protein ABIZ80_04680, partial [Bryobacteraceae bacterium]
RRIRFAHQKRESRVNSAGSVSLSLSLSLAGKVPIVTGGAGGRGSARITKRGGEALAIAADLSEPGQVADMVAHPGERFGRIAF